MHVVHKQAHNRNASKPSCLFFQASEDSEEDDLMPNKSAEVTKTRASVRMTRYLESWGAVKPFAHLNHRDSLIPEALSSSRIMVRIAHGACIIFYPFCITCSYLFVGLPHRIFQCLLCLQSGILTSRN